MLVVPSIVFSDDPVPTVSLDEIRAYAAGDLAWATLRARGVNYEDVLGGLGELGLRPPYAPMGGPNAEARERGNRWFREHLAGLRR